MSWRLAKSLIKLREQVNEAFPDRDKSSDGSIADFAHSQRKSDHNSNGAGVVTAIDIDADLSDTVKVGVLVSKLQASRDPRIKYLIWNRQITVKGDVTKWKPYKGANAHQHHCHISVSADPALYDDASDWNLDSAATIPTEPAEPVKKPQWPILERGDNGLLVKTVQIKLNALGFSLTVDSDFGPATERAVRAFQRSKGLREDGKVGMLTLAQLNL